MGGRWNSPGNPGVYASEHLSLAVLETLVHLEARRFPEDLTAYELQFPDELAENVDAASLPRTWRTEATRHSTRSIGDDWLRDGRGPVLLVPSAVVPRELNVLINPQHTEATRIRIIGSGPFAFDPRLEV